MAINQASKQFYEKIKSQEFQSLGFSFIGFIISILLSLTAVVLLYASSLDMKVRASRSSYILALRNKIFANLEEDEDEDDDDDEIKNNENPNKDKYIEEGDEIL